MTQQLLSMSDAFDRYCRLYVPNVADLDVLQVAQLKGAFAAGLHLGVGVSAMRTVDQATEQVERWMADIEAFWQPGGTP